jgi:hypothetical protein
MLHYVGRVRLSVTPIGSTKYFSNVPMLIGLWLYGSAHRQLHKKKKSNQTTHLASAEILSIEKFLALDFSSFRAMKGK